MKRALIITVAVAIPVFLSTRLIFPLPEDGPQPRGIQVPLFIGLGVAEALALGLAVATAVSARRLIKRMPKADRVPAWLLVLATIWVLGNWWVHDNLHIMVGEDITGLLAIEYGFHVTLILAGAAAVAAFARLARLRTGAQQPQRPRSRTGADS